MPTTPTPSPDLQPPPTSEQLADRANIERLELEARALAKTDGCAQSTSCRVAPVGAKACGGPRIWIPYCQLTTDEPALTRKLEELRNAETAFNTKYGIMSDCSLVAQPQVGATGGTCMVVQSTPFAR